MLICSMPECQTTAGCKCRERAERAYLDNAPLLMTRLPTPATSENDKLRATLLAIKALCAGDKVPNWKDDWATTATRGRIMDLVDGVVR